MEFHPSQIPTAKIFDVKDEKDAEGASEEMVKLGFSNLKMGYKVLMPKDSKIAKRIGYIITTSINNGLRQTNQERDLRYWTYHHDKDHYAIVLISSKVFDDLGF
ncbi:MAG TPA: hypothetical protein VH562_03745 [Nitrosopumilaceae archaeon]